MTLTTFEQLGIQCQLKMVSIKDGTMKEQLEAYKKRINALDTELRLIFYEKYMPSSAISYLKFPFENQNIPAKVSYVTNILNYYK